MKVYFLRHGESESNTLNILYNRGDKYGLTEKGVGQVKKILSELENIKVDKIYSSPLLRAKQTAQIVADNFNLDFEITDSLSEFDVGILNETGDESTFRREQEIVDQWLIRKNWDEKFEDGESYNEIKERFFKLLELIRTKEHENIILVSHGGLIQCVLPLISENLEFEYCHKNLLKNAECAILEVEDNEVKCVKYGGYTL